MIGQLAASDEQKLVGVRAPLAALVRRVASVYPGRIIVAEGLRSFARQQQLLKQKKTKTLKSKHLDGRAVDVYPAVGKGVAQQREEFTALVECAKWEARAMGLRATFGHDWGWDSPHWEIE